MRGELTTALHDLLTRRDAGTLLFDRLILETTGLADPAPIVQTFFVDDVLRERLQLDAVITLIDCEHAQRQFDEHRVAVSQAGFADRLILTKEDRVDSAARDLLFDRLRKINARAPIACAAHGQLDPREWIGIQAFDLDEALTVDAAYVQSTAANHSFRPIKQGGSLLRRSWNDDITSHVFVAGDLDIERIGAFMEHAVHEYGNDMLRYKGVLAITNESRRLIVQGVHRVVGFDYGSDWAEDETRRSLLVVIGRNLPIDAWQREFLLAQT